MKGCCCCCSGRWWCVMTVLLCHGVYLGRGQYHSRDYKQEWETRPLRTTAVSLPGHPAGSSSSSSFSTTHPAAKPADRIAAGQYLTRLFNINMPRSGRGRGTGTPAPAPAASLSTDTMLPAADDQHFTHPAGSTDHLAKSQLTVLTGDPDYTRFRQQFLRQLCRRLLNGNGESSSTNFRFCFSILGL